MRKNLIKAISDIGENDRMLVIAKRHESKIQNLVRAVCHKDLRLFNAEYLYRLFDQLRAFRIGIECELSRLRRNSLCHRGRGRIGRFIGIELDVLHIARLFTGRICL